MNEQTGTVATTRSNSEVLGEILWLFSHSPVHQRLRLFEIEQLILPAFKHQRYRIYKRAGIPIGYVAIARLSKDIEEAWLRRGYKLQPDDWASGNRLWIMHFIAPFGDTLEVRKRLWREPELKGNPIWSLRPSKNGPGLRVVKFGKYRSRHRSDRSQAYPGQPEISGPQPENEPIAPMLPTTRRMDS
jgi:cytolysin-activating lysine-acyltransferase